MHHNQNLLQILLSHTTVDSFVQKSATNFGRFIHSYWVRFVSIVALKRSIFLIPKFFIQNYPQCNVQDMYDRIGMNPLRIHGLDVSLKIQILFTYREAEFWQNCEIRTCKVVNRVVQCLSMQIVFFNQEFLFFYKSMTRITLCQNHRKYSFN